MLRERAHLLEGLLIAQDNIDEVIRIIRNSYDNAKQNLMERFSLSDVQAQAICDMRLIALQGLNREKLEQEYKELEEKMDEVLNIVVLGRACRNTANIKNRQPVADMFVKAATLPEFFVEIIEDELNVKSVEFRADMDEFIKYNIKPNFRVLGKKVGKRMGEVKAALEKLDGQAAKLELDKTGELKIGDITLTAEDIEITITQSEGFNCQSEGDVSIALSTTLTPALIEEGFVREIISKVQVMRRESDFEVTDRIKIFASGNDKLADIMTGNAPEIMTVTLANEIVFTARDDAKEWDINGEKISLAVKRI